MSLTLENFSKNYRSIVEKAIDNDPSIYEINIIIVLKDGTKLNITPEYIKNLQIHENFDGAYMDYITANILVTEYQAAFLNMLSQDLLCKLTVSRIITDTKKQTILDKDLMLFIPNKVDVSNLYPENKKFSELRNQSIEEKYVDMELEFESIFNYNVRKQSLNMIFHDVSVESTIMAIASLLKFKNVYVAKPDNQEIYKNMIIPPLTDISEIFNFLQTSRLYNGVYASGINHYIMNDTLFVFPKYQQLKTGVRINFYYVGENFIGARSTVNITDDITNIVINSKMEEISLTQQAVENIGNCFITASPRKFIDDYYSIIDNKVILKEDNTDMLMLRNSKAGVGSESFKQTYLIGNNKNNFISQLFSNISKAYMFDWNVAIPYILRPDIEINILTDNGKVTHVNKCTLRLASYLFSTTESVHGSQFICNAKIILNSCEKD